MAKIGGTSGNNTLTGTSGADQITGRLGNDVINGGAGNDILYGDMLVGEEKEEWYIIEHYQYDSGDDIIHGGAGNDTIYDRFGKDQYNSENMLFGDDGNDNIRGSGILNGGRGDDTIFLFEGEAIGGKGDDYISTFKNSIISGNDGNDILKGSGTLNGGAGNDTLEAWNTSTLHGGSGNDILKANNNNYSKILWGNQGNDTFKIGEDANKVYIKDFMKGQDHIDLSSLNLNEAPEILEHTDYYVKLDIPNHDMNIYVHVMKGQTLTSDDFIF